MAKRSAHISRKTSETDIELSLSIEGGNISIDTGVCFLDHMLELFARHGGFGLEIKAKGDIGVDFHHTTEDIAIVLGTAFREALGDKVGINRYGFSIIPMDETLLESAVDFSGRVCFVFNAQFPTQKVGDFDTELVEEFWRAFCSNVRCNLHVLLRYGSNSHHIAEGIFKSLSYSIKTAVKITGEAIMSTKGTLE